MNRSVSSQQKIQSCEVCSLLSECGGVEGHLGLAGCASFDHRECEDWKWTCVCNPFRLAERFNDVGNFKCELRHALAPINREDLPIYIPTIYHGCSGNQPVDIEWAAVPLHWIFRIGADHRLRPVANDGLELRRKIGVTETTRLIVTSPGKDELLECFWRYHQLDELLTQIKRLDVELFTAPNFSFIRNAPPLHCAYNRSRTLRVVERASQAGLNAVIHLNAMSEAHWVGWERLLLEHQEIQAVCLEFQTGQAQPAKAEQVIERLARMQSYLNRPIHPIVLGGARYAAKLGSHFQGATIVDAQPSMQTFNRKLCTFDEEGLQIRWKKKVTRRGESLRPRYISNLRNYEARVARAFKRQRAVQALLNLPEVTTQTKASRCPQKPVEELPLFKQEVSQQPGTGNNDHDDLGAECWEDSIRSHCGSSNRPRRHAASEVLEKPLVPRPLGEAIRSN